MTERNFVRQSLKTIRRTFNTNFVTRELVVYDQRGYFRPDITLIDGMRWERANVDGVHWPSNWRYYSVPIGRDLKYSMLMEYGLSAWDVATLTSQGLLERVRRGFYVRHQATPKPPGQMVMFEFKTKTTEASLKQAFVQLIRYSTYADRCILVVPFDVDLLLELMKWPQITFTGGWLGKGNMMMFEYVGALRPTVGKQAYALGRINERYARKFLERVYNG